MAAIRLDAVFKQFPSGLLVCALLVASGLVWAVMFFGPLAHLLRLAGGASPFDIRPMGYSHDEAYAFLNAIGEQGRSGNFTFLSYREPQSARNARHL
jgi:hypothetical protein